MEQILLHLLGDYVTQSDWMAQNKTSKYFPALIHATVYSLPFLLLTRSPLALFTIWSTHFLIDRFRLAKYICYAKNFLAPPSAYGESKYIAPHPDALQFQLNDKFKWENCKATGYPAETPIWLSMWLLIIADNFCHLTINYLSIRFL